MFPGGTMKRWKEEANEFEPSVSEEDESSAPTVESVDTRDEIKSFNIEE